MSHSSRGGNPGRRFFNKFTNQNVLRPATSLLSINSCDFNPANFSTSTPVPSEWDLNESPSKPSLVADPDEIKQESISKPPLFDFSSGNPFELQAQDFNDDEESDDEALSIKYVPLDLQSECEEGSDNKDEDKTIIEEKLSNDSDRTQIDEIQQTRKTIDSNTMKSLPEDEDAESWLSYFDCLAVDDILFLTGMNRDPNFQLPVQIVPLDCATIIYISEVFSPVHFWFHNGCEVESMMEELTQSYQKLGEQELIFSEGNLKPGLLVACYLALFQTWNRAKVIKPPNKDLKVRLLFIDFGTVGYVHMKNIKYLNTSFLNYPRFSHYGRLHNLKPPKGELAFTERQVNTFLRQIANKPLSAKVIKMFPEEENVFELDLHFGDELTNLRDYLIGNSLAEPFELQPKSTYPMCYFFPTFAMLESEYPTFHEKTFMLVENIHFDVLVEFNFFNNLSIDDFGKSPTLLSMMGQKKFKSVREYYFATK